MKKITFPNVQNVKDYVGNCLCIFISLLKQNKLKFKEISFIFPNPKHLLRPHALYFDEAYNQEFYREKTVRELSDNCDCLIVIGTALETSLPAILVGNAVQKGIPIIEVNPNPCIKTGNVKQVTEESETSIPIICEALCKKLSNEKVEKSKNG